ncbi:MAG TPA: PmoA family protein [Verrucomicrobiales bacterium]|nr:PmoA family protein [Verrucomicrobiales bacterium]
MKPYILVLVLAAILPTLSAVADFDWKDTEGKSLELTFESRPVASYVYEALDKSSPARREETYKPFCHIYRPGSNQDELLTKGPGGNFTHHRGIFYGFSKIQYTDRDGVIHQNVDNWHCRKACQIHRKFTATGANKESAFFTSGIDWLGDEGDRFAVESRTMRFSFSGSDLIVDFESVLTPEVPTLTLDGDPQHAGFQFRAHNDVNELSQKTTYYIRPVSGIGQPGQTINWSPKADNAQTRDLPWKGMCITLAEIQYSVLYLDHPGNPKPARASERPYGRFGTYFSTEVIPEKPLKVRYRLVVRKGETETKEIENMSAEFARK